MTLPVDLCSAVFFQGGDLFDAITQSVKFTEVDTAKMVFDLAQALYYLHSRAVVHRDLKPENILVIQNMKSANSLLMLLSNLYTVLIMPMSKPILVLFYCYIAVYH